MFARFLQFLKDLFRPTRVEPRENSQGQIVIEQPPVEVEPEVPAPQLPADPVPELLLDFSKMNIKDRNLYPLAKLDFDPDRGSLFQTPPKIVVIHHTVSYGLQSTAGHFKRNAVDIHLLVGHDGQVLQMVEFNRKAAHAGSSNWKNVSGLNDHSIGIEFVNLGPLKKLANGGYQDAYGRKYSGEVRERRGLGQQYWEPATPAQELVMMNLCRYFKQIHGIEIDNIVGHYEVSPGRKDDPYGLFSWGDMAATRKHLKSVIK